MTGNDRALYVSTSVVARALGTSRETVRRWCARGVVASRKLGGRWGVCRKAFVALCQPETKRPAE